MDTIGDKFKELRWVEDEQTRPKFDGSEKEAIKDLFIRKTISNAFVPIGIVGAVGSLAAGLHFLKKGDSNMQQLCMRGRVGFQIVAVLAMFYEMIKSNSKASS